MANPGAVYQEAGVQPDELIRLSAGTISVEVTPLGAGERFRVVTGDGEVEVRGTAFDVTAHDDRLVAVRVVHGRVEVRPMRGAMVVLNAGGQWDAPQVPAGARPRPPTGPGAAPGAKAGPGPGHPRRPGRAPAAPRVASSSRPPPPVAIPAARSPAEQAFADGWDELRSGDAAAAASLFELSLAAAPHGALAEDATFWHAVALSRAGRRAGATRALAHFVAAFPGSARVGEASMMLGWLLLEDGDVDGAARALTVAEDDRSASVRARAEAGLVEVARRRAR